jgi:adenine-specific DNA-methyltransferase
VVAYHRGGHHARRDRPSHGPQVLPQAKGEGWPPQRRYIHGLVLLFDLGTVVIFPFVKVATPDIKLRKEGDTATVEIAGRDIYDPIKDEVKSRDVHDINYWMLDANYDGSNFVVRQVFFCGGDKDEFDAWKKGLSNLAKAATKKKAEQTLKIEIDEEAFASAYGHISRPFKVKKGQKIAVRVISQFGEETTKVLIV